MSAAVLDRTRSRVVLPERAFDAGVALVLALVVVAPLARRGWLLLLDWAPGPRALPVQGVAAVPSGPLFVLPARAIYTLFGAAAGWLPIALPLFVAALGAAVLVDGARAARAAAAVAYAWNPFVYDRVYAGQLSVLAGYALLPWLLRAALNARDARGALITGLWLAAAASCSVHFAWIGAVLIIAVAAVRARDGLTRVLAGAGIVIVTAALPVGVWYVPSAGREPPKGDERVLASFGTRADEDLGRSIGLLAQQGFWRPASAEPRDDLGRLFPLVAGAAIAAAIAGLVLARGHPHARLAGAAAVAGAAGWLLAHGAAGPAGELYRVAWRHVPGFAVMREAQKWVALVSLAAAVGVALLAERLAASRHRWSAWLVPWLPIALAPSLAFGLAGRVEPSRVPTTWADARLALSSVEGDVVALPWERYLDPGFTGERVVANPATGQFGGRIVVSEDAGVEGLPGDRGRRAEIAAALARARTTGGAPIELAADLRELGVGGVLELAPGGGIGLERDPGLALVFERDGVRVWKVL
jgi:hypothetical protein